MKFSNSFQVSTDVQTIWLAFQDFETMASCLPGAKLLSAEDNKVTGEVQIKLGFAALVVVGELELKSADRETKIFVISAFGSDRKKTSTLQAEITCQLFAESPQLTRVELNTELAVTGKPAFLGADMLSGFAGRIVADFAKNLEATMTTHTAPGSGS